MFHLGAPKKSGALGCILVSLMVNPALLHRNANHRNECMQTYD